MTSEAPNFYLALKQKLVTLQSNPTPHFIDKKTEADIVKWLPLGWASW